MHTLSHLCSHIQNCFRAKLRRISVPETNANRASGDRRGPYLRGHPVSITPDNVATRRIWVDLKYTNGEPVLRNLKVVSKPSRKVFATNAELAAVASARRALTNPLLKANVVGQVTILRTPYGIVEMKDALRKNVGGEVLCIAS
ncbi:ribosomal protein S8 [Zopfochytrium polystomum]|nr:ribosomal protein S8 [Zopfochytrium polystomum]